LIQFDKQGLEFVVKKPPANLQCLENNRGFINNISCKLGDIQGNLRKFLRSENNFKTKGMKKNISAV
jgi:hypothetical protein